MRLHEVRIYSQQLIYPAAKGLQARLVQASTADLWGPRIVRMVFRSVSAGQVSQSELTLLPLSAGHCCRAVRIDRVRHSLRRQEGDHHGQGQSATQPAPLLALFVCRQLGKPGCRFLTRCVRTMHDDCREPATTQRHITGSGQRRSLAGPRPVQRWHSRRL